MQHAVQRPPAAHVHGRLTRGARALAALAVAASLACDGETPQPAPGPQGGTPTVQGAPQLATATGAQLIADAAGQPFAAHAGAGDEQMLSTIVNGQRRFGPLASIRPLRGLEGLTADSLRARGRPLARIVSDGAYPKLGIKAGTNWLYVQLVGPPDDSTSWRALMVAPDSTITNLVFNSFEDHPDDPPPPSARWLWVPNDEAIWVRCASGCCTIGRI